LEKAPHAKRVQKIFKYSFALRNEKMRFSSKAIFVVLILALLFTFSLANVQAADNQTKVDNAYKWLSDKVKTSGGWGNTEENSLSILALRNSDSALAQQGVSNLLTNSKNSGECWPQASCRVKDTALALVALNAMGADTSKAKAWLAAQQKLFLEEGNWFLQYELAGAGNGTCKAEYNYGGENRQDHILVRSDRTVALQQASLCLDVLTGKPWWAAIKSNCLQTEFFVSCQESNWLANILFISDPLYMPFTEVKSPGVLKISSKCFPSTSGGACDYDATQWATYALKLLGVDAQTRAYLESGADANKPLSYAFLYLIRQDLVYGQKLATEQSAAGYWDGSDKYFRTAISYLSVRETTLAKLDVARGWLLSNQNQDYSWGAQKQRDTAAVLWAVFSSGSTGGGGVGVQKCTDFGNVCCDASNVKTGALEISTLSCAGQIGAVCVTPSDCETSSAEETCGVDRGICCETPASGAQRYSELDDTCFGADVCASSCETAPEEKTCTDSGYCCDAVAKDATKYPNFDSTCSSGQACASECKSTSSGSGNLKLLVWILVGLVVIGLIVLLVVLMRRRKSKGEIESLPALGGFSAGPPRPMPRPMPFGPGPPVGRPMPPRMPPRPMPRPSTRGPVGRGRGKTEDELKKTLRELERIK